MTNDEIQVLLFENLKYHKLEERDQQEVVGYFQALNAISESFADIRVSEGDVKNLHKILMKHSEKDKWHKKLPTFPDLFRQKDSNHLGIEL